MATKTTTKTVPSKPNPKPAAKKTASPYVIVRGERSGVFAGLLTKREGREVTLDQCRRIWYWHGAASLSQLAMEGTSRPRECKFGVTTTSHLVLDAIEIIPATEAARTSIEGVPSWRA